VHGVQELGFVFAHVDAHGESVSDCFQLFFVVFGDDCVCFCVNEECRVACGKSKPAYCDFVVPIESGRFDVPRDVVPIVLSVEHRSLERQRYSIDEGLTSGILYADMSIHEF